MRILNLYAGIGGNRKLWGNDHEITAVEIEPKIAEIYQSFFPNDKVLIEDAHDYLLKHFEEFDFIWSSPPCPSHSRIRKIATANFKDKSIQVPQNKPIYPDMKLYEEILLLDGYAKCKWVVENVISWYDPLIKPFEVGRHYFWANFHISKIQNKSRENNGTVEELETRKGFELDDSMNSFDATKILRNCVEPELGKHVFDCAFKMRQEVLK